MVTMQTKQISAREGWWKEKVLKRDNDKADFVTIKPALGLNIDYHEKCQKNIAIHPLLNA